MFLLLFICVQILYTPIFRFFPIKHHVVLLDKYAIDFTPVDQPKIKWKLLLGKNVKGEVRIRNQYLNESLSSVDPKIKSIVKKLFIWGEKDMNLYTRNCQHFSSYAKKLAKENAT